MKHLVLEFFSFWFGYIEVAVEHLTTRPEAVWRIGYKEAYRAYGALPELICAVDPWVDSPIYHYPLFGVVKYPFQPRALTPLVLFYVILWGGLWFYCAGVLVPDYGLSGDDYMGGTGYLPKRVSRPLYTVQESAESYYSGNEINYYDLPHTFLQMESYPDQVDEQDTTDEPFTQVDDDGIEDLDVYAIHRWIEGSYNEMRSLPKKPWYTNDRMYEAFGIGPRATFDRVWDSRDREEEEFALMNLRLSPMPHHAFHPLEEAREGARSFSHLYDISTFDPFFIALADDEETLDSENYTEFMEEFMEEDLAWDPEHYLEEGYFDEIVDDFNIEGHMILTQPFEYPVGVCGLDEDSPLIPYLFPDKPEEQALQPHFWVSLETYPEDVFTPVDYGQEDALADDDRIFRAGYSTFSHNFDYGTYFRLADCLQDDVVLSVGEDFYADRHFYRALAGTEPAARAYDPVPGYIAQSFFAELPVLDVQYSLEGLVLNEDTFTEVKALEFQTALLRLKLEGRDKGLPPISIRWDVAASLYKVLNHSTLRWVSVSEYCGWVQRRADYLNAEVKTPRGAAYSVSLAGPASWFRPFLKLYFRYSDSVKLRPWFGKKKDKGWRAYISSFVRGPRTPTAASTLHSYYTPYGRLFMVLENHFYNKARDYMLESAIVTEAVRHYEDAPLYPYWTRLGIFDTNQYLDTIDEYQVQGASWMVNCFRYPVEIYPPSLPFREEEYLRIAYNGTAAEIKSAARKFRAIQYKPSDPVFERLFVAEPPESAVLYLPYTHPLRTRARANKEQRQARAIMQIVTYEFDDYSLFRYASTEVVQQLIKSQPFKIDYLLMQDPMRTIRAEDRVKALITQARVKVKLHKLLKDPVFKPLGRFEPRYLKGDDRRLYIEHKYINSYPKKFPKRRRIFRRIL